MPRALMLVVATCLFLACGGAPVALPQAPVTTAPPPPQEETIYCATLVSRRHVPDCPEPITAEQASHRGVTRVIHTKAGRPIAVEAVNGAGEPVHVVDGLAAWEYVYEGDQLKEIKNFSAGHRLVYTDVLSKGGARMDYVNPAGRPKLRWGNVAAQEDDYDEQGRSIRTRYFDRLGKPCRVTNGFHDARQRHSQLGYSIETQTFDEQGQPLANTEGIAKIERDLGPRGAVLAQRFYGPSGEPIANKSGVHTQRWSFDEWVTRSREIMLTSTTSP